LTREDGEIAVSNDLGKPGMVQAQALFLALETFPTDALESLSRGDEAAVDVLKTYAEAVVKRRHMASGADNN
jgi:hypothetical protein